MPTPARTGSTRGRRLHRRRIAHRRYRAKGENRRSRRRERREGRPRQRPRDRRRDPDARLHHVGAQEPPRLSHRRSLGGGNVQAAKSDDGDACREEIARTIADAYGGRRRWATALQAADAVGYRRDEGRLAGLLVDGRRRWLGDDHGVGTTIQPPRGWRRRRRNRKASRAMNSCPTQGEKLLRLLCAGLDPPLGRAMHALRTGCRRGCRVVGADVARVRLGRSRDVRGVRGVSPTNREAVRSAMAPRELRRWRTRGRRARARSARRTPPPRKKKAANQNRSAFASPPSARRARRPRRRGTPLIKDPAKDGEAFATPAPRPPSATRPRRL